jgi:hypothetical protein
MKTKSKSKSHSKKNHLIKSLSILKGGDDETSKVEKKSSFFDFLNKREDKPKDYNASNAPDMDEDKDADKGITFKSSKLFSILSPAESASVANSGTNGEEAPASTWWFVFRIIIVLIIILVFALNLTGYLEKFIEDIKHFFYKKIAPLFVSIGLMKTTPVVADRTGESLPGDQSKTGTNTLNQLEKNVGTKPVTTTPTATTNATPATPVKPATPATPATPVKPAIPNNPIAPNTVPNKLPHIPPIPIQPNERKTPLYNRGTSARPPASSPAPYTEERSRDRERRESVRKALEYAAKNQTPLADDATSSTQIPRTKSGYCYIGEDRGFRSCVEVSKDMECMSGDIFPRMDVCVNPRLRV